MDFQHEQSWDGLTTILALKTNAKEAWSKFIDFHEQVVPKTYWTSLRMLDIEAEQAEIVDWLTGLVEQNAVPESIVAFWIGIIKFADDDKELPAIYFSGADTYDKDDIDWACDLKYSPENRYAQLGVLQQIDEIASTDQENYEFLDWILPLGYCAFTFDEIFRTKIDKRLFLTSNSELFVAVGHDSGDYIELTTVN